MWASASYFAFLKLDTCHRQVHMSQTGTHVMKLQNWLRLWGSFPHLTRQLQILPCYTLAETMCRRLNCAHMIHSFWDGKHQTMLTPVRICAELTSQGSQVPPDTNNILLSLSLAVLTFSMSYQFLEKITSETLKVKATFDFTEGSSQGCIQSLGHSTYLHIQERTGWEHSHVLGACQYSWNRYHPTICRVHM